MIFFAESNGWFQQISSSKESEFQLFLTEFPVREADGHWILDDVYWIITKNFNAAVNSAAVCVFKGMGISTFLVRITFGEADNHRIMDDSLLISN